jgi:nucleoside phosphorylase
MLSPTIDEYTVGWICALPVELGASRAMLDEEYSPLPKDPVDNNFYTFGRISRHNVAMACLPLGQYGITSAATVATDMRRTFPNLRINLMVGVGGGAPGDNMDIRLGDVVVSKPGNGTGGVIQYDFGKQLAGGKFEQTGVLNSPSAIILTALGTMQARHSINPTSFAKYLGDLPSHFSTPGSDKDRLFDWNYDHVGGQDCGDCDKARIVPRLLRESPLPIPHYALIASGSQVMKDGRTRERLRRDHGIACFEMEAAGMLNHSQCAVIRGICDYSDSHKNKIWQPYAAATAAAYAKELLTLIPPDESTSPQSEFDRQSATVIFPHLLPSTAVGLGWLCINTREPWIDSCPVRPDLTNAEVITVPSPRLRTLVAHSGKTGFVERLRDLFSRSQKGMEIISHETLYLLANAVNIFEGLCQQDGTKKWLEKAYKYGCQVYMVVGQHTVVASRDSPSVLLALQYCKVKLRLRPRTEGASSFLASDASKWKSVRVTAGRGDDRRDQVLEACLQDISMENFEESQDVFIVDGQVVLISEARK